jgi:hypothetical protein
VATEPERLGDKFQRYAKGAEEIQKRCACIRWGARDCIEARYRRPMDDIERNSGWEDCLDEECECRCHDELRQLEEDVYGPDDDGLY